MRAHEDPGDVNDPLRRYMELGVDLARVTMGTAERVFEQLVRQGEAAAERVEQVVGDVVSRSQQNREAFMQLVRSEVERAVSGLDLVRREELEALQRQVDALRSANTERDDAPQEGPT